MVPERFLVLENEERESLPHAGSTSVHSDLAVSAVYLTEISVVRSMAFMFMAAKGLSIMNDDLAVGGLSYCWSFLRLMKMV